MFVRQVSSAMPRRAVNPSMDCARQRHSLLAFAAPMAIHLTRGWGRLRALQRICARPRTSRSIYRERPVGTRKTAMRPRTPFKSHMCTEYEDIARREIVLDTDRGCAYYSILRQARKRLSESRGGDPAGGNLENRILDRRNHFLLLISQ